MHIYYITFFLILLFSLEYRTPETKIEKMENCGQKCSRLNVILVFAVLTFFAGFRWQVGSDWWVYYSSTNADFRLQLSKTFLEPGWYSIGYISTLFYDRYGIAMLAGAALTIWLFVKTYAKYSPNFLFSSLLFFFLVWAGTFNGVRQYLAAAILFAGHRYIIKRKLWAWLLTVLIASLFHASAGLMFFWYFITTLKLNKRQVLLVAACGILVYLSYDLLFGFIEWYKEKQLNREGAYISRSINVFRILVYWIPVLYYYLFIYIRQKRDYDGEINFYGNMILLAAVLMTAAGRSAYLGRVGIYCGCFLVLAWPAMIMKTDKKYQFITTVSVILLYGMYWFYDIFVHPDLNNFQLWIGR